MTVVCLNSIKTHQCTQINQPAFIFNDMTLLFSHDDCSLISHEIYLNQIYQDASVNDALTPNYKIRSDLFDLNTPYRQKTTGSEMLLAKRQRKVKAKNAEKLMNDYPDEHALVS